MDEPMQALFNDITDRLLEKYYPKTDFAQCCKVRDEIGCKLWSQLPPEQRELLEELQRAYDYAQMEELEAILVAYFAQCKALALSHCA